MFMYLNVHMADELYLSILSGQQTSLTIKGFHKFPVHYTKSSLLTMDHDVVPFSHNHETHIEDGVISEINVKGTHVTFNAEPVR